MKFSFRPSPNYRQEQTTSKIMFDVTACLLAVLLFAIVWYSVSYGFAYGLRVILMTVFAVAAAVITEALWFKATGKDMKEVLHSYGWVTAIIIVLMSQLTVSYFAIIVATVVALVFGKLVFGGFGQNIFNPAAFGSALIMNSFGASVATDIVTGATPVTTVASAGWVLDPAAFQGILNQFGGLGQMFLGNYPTAIGGSCALLLVLCFVYLVWKGDIDWHITVPYVVTIFVVSLIVGLVKGMGFEFGVFNVISGGVLFGAVFMLTDPVTSPVTIPGKIVFGVCTAALTLIIRWKANLPDGVLFSILLMNMLTPAIDRAFRGNQIKDASKMLMKTVILSCVSIALVLLVGLTLSPKSEETASVVTDAVAYVETCDSNVTVL